MECFETRLAGFKTAFLHIASASTLSVLEVRAACARRRLRQLFGADSRLGGREDDLWFLAREIGNHPAMDLRPILVDVFLETWRTRKRCGVLRVEVGLVVALLVACGDDVDLMERVKLGAGDVRALPPITRAFLELPGCTVYGVEVDQVTHDLLYCHLFMNFSRVVEKEELNCLHTDITKKS